MIKSLKNKQGGFTLIELMVVIVIIGILVAIALPNFIGAQDRAKISSVKANMHTFQTIVETYGVDFGGVYPGTVGNGTAAGGGLWAAANDTTQGTSAYWKDFANPFTSTSGVGASYQDYAAAAIGMVGYDDGGQGSPTQYWIYGGGKTAVSVKDKGQDFILTNS